MTVRPIGIIALCAAALYACDSDSDSGPTGSGAAATTTATGGSGAGAAGGSSAGGGGGATGGGGGSGVDCTCCNNLVSEDSCSDRNALDSGSRDFLDSLGLCACGDAVIQGPCTSECASLCNAGSQFPAACVTCLNTNCSSELGDCQGDSC